jgi:hypothetical protein
MKNINRQRRINLGEPRTDVEQMNNYLREINQTRTKVPKPLSPAAASWTPSSSSSLLSANVPEWHPPGGTRRYRNKRRANRKTRRGRRT